MKGGPSVRIDRLGKSFGSVAAVADLSLTINAGEIVCLLGPNGAGKTTTINTIMGLKRPTTGDVFINGVNLHTHPRSSPCEDASASCPNTPFSTTT